MQQAAQEYEQRAAALRCEWESEKAQLARQQQREVEAVRQERANLNQSCHPLVCVRQSLQQSSGKGMAWASVRVSPLPPWRDPFGRSLFSSSRYAL